MRHVSFNSVVDAYEKRDKERKEKLDEIIKNLGTVRDNMMEEEYGYSPTLKEIIAKLEKFRDQER